MTKSPHTKHNYSSSLSRRSTLQMLAAGTAMAALPAQALAKSAKSNANQSNLSQSTPLSPASQAAQAELDAIAWDLLNHAPEAATSLGLDTGAHAALRTRLEDRSFAGKKQLADSLRRHLNRLHSIDTAPFDHATRTSVSVVKSAFKTALDGFNQPYGDVAVGGWRNTPYVVIQNVGAYLDTPRFLDSDHPVKTREDADAYIARLGQFAAQLDGESERIQAAREQGLIPPDFLLDRAIAQMQTTIADCEKNGGSLVSSIATRAQSLPQGAAGETGAWSKDAARLVQEQVVPALKRQLALLQQQRSQASSAPGMRERPHGEEFYAWALRASTTTSVSPQDIHARGLEELAALHARMDSILKDLGYTNGSVGARMTALGEDKRFMFSEDDPGRKEIVAFIRDRVNWIRAQMPRAFRQVVAGNVDIVRLPLSEEPGAPTAYGGAGSIDGSVPGKMWINLRTTDLHRKYDLPTLVHHEAIPGHVWQGEYANRLPLIRSVLAFNAYSEGWALYGEQLADELGAYDSDPVGRLGYLQSIAFRACRMVVDTGLHSKGWSREQAVRFFMEENGNKREEVVNEVDRYCSWPGQACGYKMGHTQIVSERKRAQSLLGARYDLRDFNQVVVDGGNVPLDVLALNVDAYIKAHTA